VRQSLPLPFPWLSGSLTHPDALAIRGAEQEYSASKENASGCVMRQSLLGPPTCTVGAAGGASPT
jgi:hypothetical protein